MVEKPEYRTLIQPVAGLPEAKQMEMLARFEPAEVYVCHDQADIDAFTRQMRAPRIALVVYAGLLGEQRGSKLDRVDSMTATKAEIHKRGCHIVEASGRSSLKSWPAMKRDGEDMCRRLAQGAKSALNGKKGTKPLADDLSDTDLRDLLRVMQSKKYTNHRLRKAAIKRLAVTPVPGRTWLIQILPGVCRARGILE